jgi:hypothetical protein
MIFDSPLLYTHRGDLLLAKELVPALWRGPWLRKTAPLCPDSHERIRSARPYLYAGRHPRHRALPDYAKVEFGTAVVWGEAGASGVTLTMTLDALASGSARAGAVADLTATPDEEYCVVAAMESGTGPLAGNTIDVFLPTTHSTSYYANGVSYSGSDTAWPVDGNEDEHKLQIGFPVVSVVSTLETNTLQTQAGVIWRPAGRYCYAVVDNNWPQAIRDETTATNNDSRVILTPRRFLVQDAA